MTQTSRFSPRAVRSDDKSSLNIADRKGLEVGSSLLMVTDWKPESATIRVLVDLGIPERQIRLRILPFKRYYLFSNVSEVSWDARFIYFVIRSWKSTLAEAS